jgi:hypothetical protein
LKGNCTQQADGRKHCVVLLEHSHSHGKWPGIIPLTGDSLDRSVGDAFTYAATIFDVVLSDSYSADMRSSKSPQGPTQRNDITKRGGS